MESDRKRTKASAVADAVALLVRGRWAGKTKEDLSLDAHGVLKPKQPGL